ncbi:NAD(P)/FAD-dependent oxidoreductase [Priestia taiwanensis]|uniref:Oxidoreductase n=1 Tax=Priestia taiwanensis TaxID=1347902 RepID=A0A917ART1_9BACI|nr:FAD-dependent oxidoreductase [Priestia taiwanensis]MBM7364020.1 glycine/D-amino acid oxidase-like deaminating enzyme [Priestia taiwanensis]GGE71015.1 oxidoreductase [Priestia taiwanensis]
MNLHTGKLFWPHTYAEKVYPPLEEDVSCDVLIIGGGACGAHCAYFLGLAGISTVLVEKRGIGGGSTSANTGLLQFCNDKTLTSFIHTLGEEKAVRFYTLCKQAVDQLGEITATLPVYPDFVRRGSLYVASREADVPALHEEYMMLHKHGFAVEYMLDHHIRAKFPFTKSAAIYTHGDAEVNPFKLVHGLVGKAKEHGVRVYGNTEIVHHIQTEEGLVFWTKEKRQIRAKHAIFAPGYEGQDIVKDKNAVLTSSYAVVTNTISNMDSWYERCLIWETARPYLYMRTTVDNRIVIGGKDEVTIIPEKRDSMLIHKRYELMSELRMLFPAYEVEPEFYWSATFGSTHDGLPIIGQYEGYENCYFLYGYGGNGTIYSVLFAQIVRDLITKGTHPHADLFLSTMRR